MSSKFVLFCLLLGFLCFLGYYYSYYESEPRLLLEVQVKMNSVQEERMKKVREKCSKRSRYLYNLHDLMVRQRQKTTHFYVLEEQKVIYCGVPKTGSSNWKRVLLMLNGVNISNLKNPQIHQRPLTKLFHQVKKSEIEHMVKHYFKFIFVRHPFERIVSAYRNKFADNNRYFEKTYGSRILRAYRHNLTQEQYKRGRGVTFDEFARWLVEKRVFNPHWASMTSLCHPCVVPFNFVGKMETFDDDVTYMLRVLGTSVSFPSNHKKAYNVSSAHLMKRYFSKLSLTVKAKLYRTYRNDFETFGYTIPDHFKSYLG